MSSFCDLFYYHSIDFDSLESFSRVAIPRDSNISRVTGVNSKNNLVDLHSFPGAKLIHFKKMGIAGPSRA